MDSPAWSLLASPPMILTRGAAESASWLKARGLDASQTQHWFVEIEIATEHVDTRLELNLYPEEWGFVFRSGVRVSSIRVTDVPFVHGSDDHRLLAATPTLDRLADLIRDIESRIDVRFSLTEMKIRSNLRRASVLVREWAREIK